MSNDLISKAALKAKMQKLYEYHIEMSNFSADNAVADCVEMVEQAPTIEPQVAHCAECIHFYENSECLLLYDESKALVRFSRSPNDYCSSGKRMDAEGEEAADERQHP